MAGPPMSMFLDDFLVAHLWLGECGHEGIEVDHEQVDGLEASGGERL